MFGSSYPVTSLKRDDPRTLRFLRMLGTEYTVADLHGRALDVQAGSRDPGPTFLAQLALMAEQIGDHYEARDYAEANDLQKRLANRVARLAKDPDVPLGLRSTIEHQIIQGWKQVWQIAEDASKTRIVLDGNAGVIAAKKRLLNLS